jgi:adenine-specific DNA methylase
MFAIEYWCKDCYPTVRGRQFKSPTQRDRERYETAATILRTVASELQIPPDTIPNGDETDRLHRWGYQRYRDMFNDRQLLGLGLLQKAITKVPDQRMRHALATVFSDFLRYQNLLARYDTYALKCQDIFSVHGYPVGLIACEDSLLGIPGIGSGSFAHFVAKFERAKVYAKSPHETRLVRSRNSTVAMEGEHVEAPLASAAPALGTRSAWLSCGTAQSLAFEPHSLDGVFTDPPYFANVQYAELMDFCFVWLRTMLNGDVPEFERSSTRSIHELTGNLTLGRDVESFTTGISDVFRSIGMALKLGASLSFTYHHNDPLAYGPIAVALLDAGFTCTAVLPTPAEMTASRHIARTKSSILDSVFVCRLRRWVDANPRGDEPGLRPLWERVADDEKCMAEAGYHCTKGDLQCLEAGHVAADAVRVLGAENWIADAPVGTRLSRVSEYIRAALVDRT